VIGPLQMDPLRNRLVLHSARVQHICISDREIGRFIGSVQLPNRIRLMSQYLLYIVESTIASQSSNMSLYQHQLIHLWAHDHSRALVEYFIGVTRWECTKLGAQVKNRGGSCKTLNEIKTINRQSRIIIIVNKS